MIRFACPICSAIMEAPPQKVGQKISCLKCGQRLQIPPPPQQVTVLATPVAIPNRSMSIAAQTASNASPTQQTKWRRVAGWFIGSAHAAKRIGSSRRALPLIATAIVLLVLIAVAFRFWPSPNTGQANPIANGVIAPGNENGTSRAGTKSDGKSASIQPEQPQKKGAKQQTAPKDDPVEVKTPPKLHEEDLIREPLEALGTREALAKVKIVKIQGKARSFGRQDLLDDEFADIAARVLEDAGGPLKDLFKTNNSFSNDEREVTITWQSLDRVKFEEKGLFFDLGHLLKERQGWRWDGTRSAALTAEELPSYAAFNYSAIISTILPLKTKGFSLQRTESGPIKGRDCYCIKVHAHGRPDLLLFFDRKSNLLRKSQFLASKAVTAAKKDMLVDSYFDDYRDVNGVKHWWTYEQHRNGEKHAEIRLSRIDFFDELDDARFFSLPKGGTSAEVPLKANGLEIHDVLSLRDPKDDARGQRRRRNYTVRMVAGKTYQIDMVSRSPRFDPFLRLEDATNNRLAQDDDGGGFPNARIIFECRQDGEYQVICTTFNPGIGRYTLMIREK